MKEISLVETKTREKLEYKQATTYKQVSYLVPKVRIYVITIDNHMVIIQVQIGKNIIEDVLLDGGSRVNIIT